MEQRTGNSILDSIEVAEFGELEPHLEPVELGLQHEIFSPGRDDGYCYFPVTAVVSLLRGFSDGTQVEVAVVGHEGLLGLHSLLGEDLEPGVALIQSQGRLLRIRATHLSGVFWRGRSLQKRSLRFTYALMSAISQAAACNQLHMVEPRLARWLLSMWDRADGDELPLSHEFLALMLGVTRPRVTQSIGSLTGRGAIESQRKSVRLLDREKLHEAACECYEEVVRVYGDLLSSRPELSRRPETV